MNLSELRTAVRTRCGYNANDTMHTDASLNQFINEAIRDLANEHDWPWLIRSETLTTTSGTATVTPSTDWVRTVDLHLTTPRERLEPTALASVRRWQDSNGRPRWFSEVANTLTLAPVPDGVYTLIHDFIRDEDELSSDSDVPLMPAAYHDVLVARAAYLSFTREGNIAEAAVARDDYLARTKRMRLRLTRTGRPILPRVRPGGGFG